MRGGTGVFAGVLIRRAVATQRHTAFLTGSQVYPLRPNLHALNTLGAVRKFDRPDCRKMDATSVGHTSHRFQILVNELDCHRPFANGRSDAFD
jgi:hypothetical protein